MDGLRTRTFTGLVWSGGAQIARQTIQLVMSIILARLLEPHDFGLIGMVVVVTGFGHLFTDLGLGAALIQRQQLTQAHLSTVFWLNLIMGGGLTVLIISIAPIIAMLYQEPALIPLTRVLALNFLIGAFRVVQYSLLQKDIDFQKLSCIEITASLLSGGMAISAALLQAGVWSLVLQSLLFTTLVSLMLWWSSSWHPSFVFHLTAMKDLIGFSSNLLGFSVFNYWIRNLDDLLIGRYLGSAALGIYTRSYSLMLLPLSQVSAIVTRVMFPALSSIQHDTPRVRHLYLRATRSIALVTFPLMIGLLVVARPFIFCVYGSQWQAVIPVLQIFCITGMGQAIGTTVGWIYTSQGRTDIMLKWGIFSGSIYVVSFLVGLRWGVLGVATSYTLFGYVILWYPGWTIPGRLIQLHFRDMVKNISGVFAVASMMGAVVWLVGILLPQNWHHCQYLLVQIPLGFFLYAGLAHVFQLKAYQETRLLIQEHIKLLR
jgi:O-antigen/teichoic acid export membrane protein